MDRLLVVSAIVMVVSTSPTACPSGCECCTSRSNCSDTERCHAELEDLCEHKNFKNFITHNDTCDHNNDTRPHFCIDCTGAGLTDMPSFDKFCNILLLSDNKKLKIKASSFQNWTASDAQGAVLDISDTGIDNFNNAFFGLFLWKVKAVNLDIRHANNNSIAGLTVINELDMTNMTVHQTLNPESFANVQASGATVIFDNLTIDGNISEKAFASFPAKRMSMKGLRAHELGTPYAKNGIFYRSFFTEFDMTKSDISVRVHSHAFSGMTVTERFSMSQTSLPELTSRMFAGTVVLGDLEMRNLSLEDHVLKDKTFDGLILGGNRTRMMFDLSRSGITRVGNKCCVKNSSKCTKHPTKTGPFTGIIGSTSSSYTLDLSHNKINTVCQGSFRGLSVDTLDLSHNDIVVYQPGWGGGMISYEETGGSIHTSGNPSTCKANNVNDSDDSELASRIFTGSYAATKRIRCVCSNASEFSKVYNEPGVTAVGASQTHKFGLHLSFCIGKTRGEVGQNCSGQKVEMLNSLIDNGRYKITASDLLSDGRSVREGGSLTFACDAGYEPPESDMINPYVTDPILCVNGQLTPIVVCGRQSGYPDCLTDPDAEGPFSAPRCIKTPDSDASEIAVALVMTIFFLLNGWVTKDFLLRGAPKHKDHTIDNSNPWLCEDRPNGTPGCGKRFRSKHALEAHHLNPASCRPWKDTKGDDGSPIAHECPFCPYKSWIKDCGAVLSLKDAILDRTAVLQLCSQGSTSPCITCHVHSKAGQLALVPYDPITGDKLWTAFALEIALALATIVPFVAVAVTHRQRKELKLQTQAMKLGKSEAQAKEALARLELEKNKKEWEIDSEKLSPRDMWTELGKGGFGTVYRTLMHGDVEVAVKEMNVWSTRAADKNDDAFDPTALDLAEDEFDKELTVMKSLRHPNLVIFYGVAVSSVHRCLVLEFMEYGTVRDILRKGPRAVAYESGPSKRSGKSTLEFGWDRRLDFVRDIASGMRYLHLDGKWHRDLKSENCLVAHDGTCKIGDFGTVLQRRGGAASSRTSSRTATVGIGTLLWQAPEVRAGTRAKGAKYNASADVFSYGITMLAAFYFPYSVSCSAPPVNLRFSLVGTKSLQTPTLHRTGRGRTNSAPGGYLCFQSTSGNMKRWAEVHGDGLSKKRSRAAIDLPSRLTVSNKFLPGTAS